MGAGKAAKMILALETATTACSAALCAADGSVVAERLSLNGPAHSRLLLTYVREVMEDGGAGWDDIVTIAAGLGPGAFTGLRIGVATARGLVQADDGRVQLAGVPTTTAVALAMAGDEGSPSVGPADALASPDDAGSASARPRLLVPLVDGRRREVFAAVFERSDAGGIRRLQDDAVVPADRLADWLAERGAIASGERSASERAVAGVAVGSGRPSAGKRVVADGESAVRNIMGGRDGGSADGDIAVGGDGAVLYRDLLPAWVRVLEAVAAPSAAMVGRAVACGAPGLVHGPDAVLPIYGRAPDAVSMHKADTSQSDKGAGAPSAHGGAS